MIRPIAIGLAPNLSAKDALLACQKIFSPFSYKKGNTTYLLEKWFEKYFSVASATAFTSGRGALYAILKSLKIGKGDEVILQAFTCAAVVQAILTVGARPIYADIDESFTLDPASVKKCLSSKTKAILMQYTFGIAGNIEEVARIAKEKNIYLVEDVAHSIGGTYKNKKLGTFGIASIFSFGRDKAFSSTSGGIAIAHDKNLGTNMHTFAKQKMYPRSLWIFQQLLHPVVFYFFVLPFYNVLLGKIILVLLQKLHLLSLPVDTKRTVLSEDEVKKLPPVLSELILAQLQQLKKVNTRRQEIGQRYEEKLPELTTTHYTEPLLRYPLLVDDPQKIISRLKNKHIYIGNWYSNTLDPKGVNLGKLQYTKGSCPKAEDIAHHIINLPTYASLSDNDIERICQSITKYATPKTTGQ